MKRISVDIGGTFTDCFVAWEGQYIQTKALTTHHNLAQGFNEALDQASGQLGLSRRRRCWPGWTPCATRRRSAPTR